jgi:hypothetical protein
LRVTYTELVVSAEPAAVRVGRLDADAPRGIEDRDRAVRGGAFELRRTAAADARQQIFGAGTAGVSQSPLPFGCGDFPRLYHAVGAQLDQRLPGPPARDAATVSDRFRVEPAARVRAFAPGGDENPVGDVRFNATHRDVRAAYRAYRRSR